MADLLFPYHLRTSGNLSEYSKYFQISTMHESSRFLIFSLSIGDFCHLVYYDKVKKETMVCNTPSDLEFYKNNEFSKTRCIGFSNDLDQFVPIGTDKNFYINSNDEFVAVIPAVEIKRWFKMNPDKEASLPEHLRTFGDIKEEDNPVIIVARLKNAGK